MIYVIRAIGTGYVKIGVSTGKDISLRLTQLQVGCPFELAIVAAADWPSSTEARIHRHLHRDHIRGEWFKLGDHTRKAIKLIQKGDLAEWDRYIAEYPASYRAMRLGRALDLAYLTT